MTAQELFWMLKNERKEISDLSALGMSPHKYQEPQRKANDNQSAIDMSSLLVRRVK